VRGYGRLRGVSAEMQTAARVLRQSQTAAEAALWQALRGGKLDGLKFRRQHPVASFVVDFYCAEHHLVIEVDGSVHDEPEQKIRDANKDEFLRMLGNTVLRIRNEDVLHNLIPTLDRIRRAAANSSHARANDIPALPTPTEPSQPTLAANALPVPTGKGFHSAPRRSPKQVPPFPPGRGKGAGG
jgi:very-short-patch-repair endonuclease